jgi:pilus assembly protein Flp/PilA
VFTNSVNHDKGQGLVEYAMIMILVALVVIAALAILGPIVGNVFSRISNPLTVLEGSTDVPGSNTPGDAIAAFCSGNSTGTNVHVYVNSTTGTYLALSHDSTIPTGYTLVLYSSCP